MPGASLNSIERQLEEYRLRRRMEHSAALIADNDASRHGLGSSSCSSDHPVPVSSYNTSSFYKRLSRRSIGASFVIVSAVLNLGTHMWAPVSYVCERVGDALYHAVLPDRLLHRDEIPIGSTDFDSDFSEPEDIWTEIRHSRSRVGWRLLLLKLILWVLMWGLFIFWGFGAVFFLASGFVFIGCNLRTGPRRVGEQSAYSVFNEGCESIEGTVSAEQLQREMLFIR